MTTKDVVGEVIGLVGVLAVWVVIGAAFGDGPPPAGFLLVFAAAWVALRALYYAVRAFRHRNDHGT